MSSYAYESDDDDKPLPPLKNRKQRGEFDDDDAPIRPKKISKQPDATSDGSSDEISEADIYVLNNTKKG